MTSPKTPSSGDSDSAVNQVTRWLFKPLDSLLILFSIEGVVSILFLFFEGSLFFPISRSILNTSLVYLKNYPKEAMQMILVIGATTYSINKICETYKATHTPTSVPPHTTATDISS